MRTVLPALSPWQLHNRPEQSLLLRRATVADVVELAALKRRVESRCYAGLAGPEALATRLRERCSAWYLLTRIGEGDLVLVAELDGEVIGMAAASIEGSLCGPVLRLHSAYVERPGHGAGRALTNARLEAAAQLGVEDVVADALIGVEDAARRLAVLGMHDTGQRRACPGFPGVQVARWSGRVQTALQSGSA